MKRDTKAAFLFRKAVFVLGRSTKGKEKTIMKKKKNSKKIVGALLALTMCISSMGASVSAMGMETEHMKEEVYVEGQNPEAVSESEENGSEQSDQTRTILRFQNLTEEVAFQSVMQGTSQEKLNLPEMLEAEDAANNKITVPVIWEIGRAHV